MLVSTLKPKEEILGYLRDGERVFVVACSGCAEVCEAGGEKALEELRSTLETSGHPVVGGKAFPFLCNKALVGIGLSRVSGKVEEADAVLVAACGVGVQTVASVLEKPVFPASNTLTYGAFQGIWPSEERCARCGECILAYTGGICPLTVCPKSLLHGPCGGSYQGECEVEKGRSCGWQRIYDRLAKIGRLDLFVRFKPPKDRQKEFDVPLSRRKSIFWALEYAEEEG